MESTSKITSGWFPPPSGSSVDVEAAFATAVLETVKLIAPPRERRLMPGRGWRGDVQVEAELNTAMTARLVAWRRQKADKQNNQLKRAVRREKTQVQRVCDVAYARFLEKHI